MSKKITVSDSTFKLLERLRVDVKEETMEELVLCLLYEALAPELKYDEKCLDKMVE